MNVQDIPLEQIFADPEFNCRGDIAPIDVVELARSIDQIGLQQPISVEEYKHSYDSNIKYRVILGHRRFKAFELLNSDKIHEGKYSKIPCTIQGKLSRLEAIALNLIENLDRKQLNIMQEAFAIQPFLKSGWTQQAIAAKLNQSTGWVQVRVAALKMEPEIQEQIKAGLLTQTQIKDLAGVLFKEKRFEIVKEIIEAKERGERKINVKEKLIRDEDKGKIKKFRVASEIFKKQLHIRQIIGNCFGTRCLAWAAGAITDDELEQDIREQAEEKGINYEVLSQVQE